MNSTNISNSEKMGIDSADIPLSEIDVSPHHLFESGQVLPLFERLRREDPVHLCTKSAYGPYWSITRYDDIMHVDTNPQVFSSAIENGGISIDDNLQRPPGGGYEFNGFIVKDPPLHAQYRKAVQPIVSNDSLQSLKALIQQRTSKVLDTLPFNEEFDWVKMVSIELTTMMMATLFDIPLEDRHMLAGWSDATGALEGAEGFVSHEHRVSQLMECLDYFTRLLNQRKNSPPQFDLVSMLAHDPVTRNLKPMDYLGQILLLLVGSNDTTRNSMSGSVNCINLFPDEFGKLKNNQDLIDNMVNEVIRWQTPICHQRRTAMVDTRIRDKILHKGDKVVMWYYSGNRDEDVFPNGNAISLDRAHSNRHLAFGFGIHRCMGLRVAELQLSILWRQILDRFDNIELVRQPKRLRSNQRNGYTEMMVRIKPKS
jgi:cytochrome P450